MKITFGTHFDSPVFPALADIKPAAFGETYAGPMTLVSLLETTLGLPVSSASFPERVAAWMQKMRSADNGRRFYSASFHQDAPGSAAFLLRKRDELVLAGWQASERSQLRLADLASIERAAPELPPGTPERLQAVMDNLPSGRLHTWHIDCISSQDELEPLWQKLFHFISKSGAVINWQCTAAVPTALAPANTDLGQFQRLLTDAALDSKTRPPLRGDGSLVLIHSPNESVAADYLASYLQQRPERKSDTLLLIPDNDLQLQGALRVRGNPTSAFKYQSAQSPVSGILTLALELLWKPVHPRHILEFLGLPVSPINRIIANALARSFAKKPGIGNPDWNCVLQKQAGFCHERFGHKSHAQYIEPVKILIDRQRYDAETGIPAAELRRVINYLGQWSQKRAHSLADADPLQPELLTLLQSCEHLLSLIGHTSGQLKRLDLDRLTRLIHASGVPLRADAELDSWSTITHPAAINNKSVADLIWWNCTGDNLPPMERFWSQKEIEYLVSQKVYLKSNQQALAEYQTHAIQAALHAADRLLLFWPESIQGQSTSAHFFIARLEAAFANLQPIKMNPAQWSDWIAKKEQIQITAPIKSKLLPSATEAWHLNQAVPTRPQESFSSLNKLFFAPQFWFLEYALQLRHDALLNITEDSRLDGSLAHALLQQLIQQNDLYHASEQEIDQWTHKNLEQFIEQEGLIYLLPGKELEHRRLHSNVSRAAHSFLGGIRNSGWQVDGIERKVAGPVETVPVTGFIDLALQKPGRKCVVDLKWSGKQYKIAEFKENRPLQLALYASLFGDQQAADYCYFIISNASWIAPDANIIQDAVVIDSENGNYTDLLDRFRSTWEYRTQQLQQGLIELVTPESTLPDNCFSVFEKVYPAEDYAVLFGLEG
ncbi:MAG: PD-(D/E)XK nuclease family protein [Leptospiraceae bacterium]|nr:PD-(D/E)XK nuclease family protein [Leptospiraceae bacterium]